MNSGTNDVTCYRAYLPDALRLRFEDNLSIRAIAQHLSLSHSTVHVLFQRFIVSGIKWPLPETLSFTQLDQTLFTNRKKNYDTFPNKDFNIWHFPQEMRAMPGSKSIRPDYNVPLVKREELS
ncbi:hypothetical protein ACFWYK_018120 [Salmonella enterica]|uniref:hypothetical protein n=1 Tax=Salmonella enterica TaxID=28901 RepID=UPI003A934594